MTELPSRVARTELSLKLAELVEQRRIEKESLENLEEDIRANIIEQRKRGVLWDELGKQIGLTKQGVWVKYREPGIRSYNVKQPPEYPA